MNLKDWVRNHQRVYKIARKTLNFFTEIRKQAYYIFSDMRELLSNQRDELVPPMRMRHWVGPQQEFKASGQEFLKIFVEQCGLKPDEHVLDVGCGLGRIAGPLARYLNENGSYEGFDIVAKMVSWDKKTFEPKFPNFHFQLADVYDKEYNPKGKYKASEYKFPFENQSFDFVFLTSVFTHMLMEDVERYFAEIARVLKPGGRCLISCFLLNKASLEQIGTKDAYLNFQYEIDGYRTINKEIPEAAVAYKEETMRELCRKNKLNIVEPINYGWWCKREYPWSFQDVIVAVKRE